MAAAALLLEYPKSELKFLNRGISGNTVGDILARWQQDCLNLKPDIVSLLAGVNDTLYGRPPEQTAHDYRALLEWTRRELPTVRLISLEPFLLGAGQITSRQIAELAPRQKMVRQLAGEFGALFVPLQEPLSAAADRNGAELYSYDGIHPAPAGAALIAKAWLQLAVTGLARLINNSNLPLLFTSGPKKNPETFLLAAPLGLRYETSSISP